MTGPDSQKHFYGCVHCRKYHYEGQSLYQDHYWWQSVHGVKEISEKAWALEMLRTVELA